MLIHRAIKLYMQFLNNIQQCYICNDPLFVNVCLSVSALMDVNIIHFKYQNSKEQKYKYDFYVKK